MSAFDPKRTSRDHAENRGLHPAAPEWRPAIAEAAANGLGKMSDVEDVAVDVCLRGYSRRISVETGEPNNIPENDSTFGKQKLIAMPQELTHPVSLLIVS